VMEIFGPTIQGEGLMSGTVTHFLRTGGCGLRCSWCDSMFAVDPAQIKAGRTMMSLAQILGAIESLGPAPYITFTGGDPCIHKDLGDIIHTLNMHLNMRVAVETQGEIFPEWLKDADVITFSPKGPSSGNVVDYTKIGDWIIDTMGMGRRAQLICIKIVCFNDDDLSYAMQAYTQLNPLLYDSFYFTAGTPLAPTRDEAFDVDTKDVHPDSEAFNTIMEARALHKVMGIVSGQRWLADKILMKAQHVHFNNKVHIGSQQHALIWPEYDRGR